MDFLKKHYEKITLAGALILLIVSAVLLAMKVSALSTELNEAPRRAPKPELTRTFLCKSFRMPYWRWADPPIWSTNADLTISARRLRAAKTNDYGHISIPTNGLPILVASVHKPFTLLFKTYSYDVSKAEGIISSSISSIEAHSFFVRTVGDASRTATKTPVTGS